MDSFQGDFSSLWTLQQRPPLDHLTWDWWWWLVMLDDPKNVEPGKQLMVLWSTKDNKMVQVHDVPWNPKGKPGFDEHGGIQLDGMVCAWWFDGSVMHDEIISHVCDMIVLPAHHPSWPSNTKSSLGGGAVVPLLDSDCSMGMLEDHSKFWLNLNLSEKSPIRSVQLDLTPWNPAMSTARQANATYAANMGYDILRLHGTKVSGVIDDESVSGTAYFQKVCVQAPSVPWYWGMLHFSDGSYLDWFLPHASLTMLSRDARAWKKRDISHIALSQGGLFHELKINEVNALKLYLSRRINSQTTCRFSMYGLRMGGLQYTFLHKQLNVLIGISTNLQEAVFGLTSPTMLSLIHI